MDFFVHHGLGLFLLAIFPCLGLLLEITISSKVILYILILASILLSPILMGYKYIIPSGYNLSILLILAVLYSFLSRKIKNLSFKIIIPLLSSIVLTIILSIYALFMKEINAHQLAKIKWNVDGYQVVYIYEKKHLENAIKKYELNEFASLPIFIKKIEVVIEKESFIDCKINFQKSQIVFDKCNGSITQNAR
jgi:hypothetical protein